MLLVIENGKNGKCCELQKKRWKKYKMRMIIFQYSVRKENNFQIGVKLKIIP